MKKRSYRAQKVNEVRWEEMADRVKDKAVVWAINVAKVERCRWPGPGLVPVPHPVDQARGAIPHRLFRPGPQELTSFLTDLNQGGLMPLAESGPDRIWVGRGRANIRQRRRKVGASRASQLR